jgi:hypothetical protein
VTTSHNPQIGGGSPTKISNRDLLQSLQAFQQTLKQIHSAVQQAQGTAIPDGPLGTPYELGDLVWVKRHHPDSLQAVHWQGSYCDPVHSHSHQGSWKTPMDSSYSAQESLHGKL